MGRQFCVLRGRPFPSAVFLELVTRREHLEDAWTSRSQVRDGTKVQGRVRKQGSMLRSKFINVWLPRAGDRCGAGARSGRGRLSGGKLSGESTRRIRDLGAMNKKRGSTG